MATCLNWFHFTKVIIKVNENNVRSETLKCPDSSTNKPRNDFENAREKPIEQHNRPSLIEEPSFHEYDEAVKFYSKKFDFYESCKVHCSHYSKNNEKNFAKYGIGSLENGVESCDAFELSGNSENTRSRHNFDKLNLTHCPEYEIKFIRKLCNDFKHQFYVGGDILGATDINKHHIKIIPGSKVINIRQYRIPHKHRSILQEIINDFERQGIIERCQSIYNSNKKDDLGTQEIISGLKLVDRITPIKHCS